MFCTLVINVQCSEASTNVCQLEIFQLNSGGLQPEGRAGQRVVEL